VYTKLITYKIQKFFIPRFIHSQNSWKIRDLIVVGTKILYLCLLICFLLDIRLKIVYKHCALYCTFGLKEINYFLVDLTIFEFFNLKSHLYEIFSIELEELRWDLKNTLYNNGSIISNINISQSLHLNENFFMILDMIN